MPLLHLKFLNGICRSWCRNFKWAALALFLAALPLRAEDHVNVVASFSILADFARNVAGERARVTSLVGRYGDVHVYTPAPADVGTIADAGLVVVNGLGLEGWLPRLLQSAGSRAGVVMASKGIVPLKLGSKTDPHAWQSVVNAKIYVANIRDALVEVDPTGADDYRKNTDVYLTELDALDAEVRAAIAKIPPARRKLISTHDAFGYFAAAYGFEIMAPLGVSTEVEPGARDLARIIAQVKASGVRAVFPENISDERLIRRISAETGASIGGTLYTDSLTDEKGDAPTYIALVRHNIRTLTDALGH